MIARLEATTPAGHVTLTWNPDDEAEVAAARAEFERLRADGYLLFASRQQVDEFDPTKLPLDVRAGVPPEPVAADLEQTRTFKPRARRTVAVAPMRGGC